MRKPIYIRDVAAAGDVTPQAVRYYESLDLLEKPHRTKSGYRIYTREAIERIRFIKDAQKLGLNLDEIRVILQMKCSMQPPCDCVREMLHKKLARIEKQIAEMDATRKRLLKVLRNSEGNPPLAHEDSVICPLIEKSATE
ncbi:MAG: MerR family DNA-binding protein [Acidobacteriota bacterium]